MHLRGACYNCGMVDYYKLPYRALIEEFDRDDPTSASGYTVDDDDKKRRWICNNCGWERMIVLYHDNLKSPEPLKASEVDFTRGS